jgi:hypothetical protein
MKLAISYAYYLLVLSAMSKNVNSFVKIYFFLGFVIFSAYLLNSLIHFKNVLMYFICILSAGLPTMSDNCKQISEIYFS